MGKKVNAQRERDSDYVRAIYKLCEFIVYRGVRPWFSVEWLWRLTSKGRQESKCLKTVHRFTESVIRERKRERLAMTKINDKTTKSDSNQAENSAPDDIYLNGRRRLAFLDLLLEAQENLENQLSDRDLREEVDTFMFEGHDTTAAALSWALFMLACHPEHQKKVQKELDEIFGQDRTRSIETQDLAKMQHLELCIKETLRLYPSVPFIARHLKKDLILDEKTTIPAGVNACLMLCPMHHNDKVFPDPDKFQPERFLPENSIGRHPFSYIPFSAGPRNCIGQKFAMMEEKVILANIFRNFTVEAAESRENVIVMVEVITRPRDGLKVKFIPRQT